MPSVRRRGRPPKLPEARCPACGAVTAGGVTCRACELAGRTTARQRPPSSFSADARLEAAALVEPTPDDVLEAQARDHLDYLPTPAEIRAGCLAIQVGWSDAERAKRLVGPGIEGWSPELLVGLWGERERAE